jgi:hypothetical protein
MANLQNATDEQIKGSSYIGVLHPIKAPAITAILGEPTDRNDEYSHFMWYKIVDGGVITVYDRHCQDCDVEWVEDGNEEWTVGGHGQESVELAKKLFGEQFHDYSKQGTVYR